MYVDAIYNANVGTVSVVERLNGKRVFNEIPAIYDFYVQDHSGRHKSIYGESLQKISAKNHKEYTKQKKMNLTRKTYESDIKPIYRVLSEYYLHKNPPETHNLFFDIEVDFDQDSGYSQPEEARNPIISVAVHLQWLGQTICLAVPPKDISEEEAESIAKKFGNVILYDTEREMLDAFLLLIEDADIISGWNSEGYDIPYTVNRIMQVMGRAETRRLCLWNKMPNKKEYVRGGRPSETYELFGRVHLDYLQLYKKFTYEERHSYSLDNIAEAELGERKVPYDGTLDQLYRQDFEKFLQYNIQDTELLDKLDRKLQYIDLASSIAHENAVLIPASLGAVAVTEQAIINEAHSRGMFVPDRSNTEVSLDSVYDEEHADLEEKAAGGWVQHPKKGLHKWIGSMDLNSLYPSVIRALNMSPETIVGQIRTTETDTAIMKHVTQPGAKKFMSEWWNDRFHVLEMEYFYDLDNSHRLNLDFADGSHAVVTGAEVRQLVFNEENNWCISANGTIFRTDIEGVIPSLLTRWYAERKVMQKIKREYDALTVGIKLENCKVDVDALHEYSVTPADAYDIKQAFSIDTLHKKAENTNPDELFRYLAIHQLTIRDGHVYHRDDEALKKIVGFWDKRQLVKKISLNSLYGGLLNAGCRFYDKRLGQSTTLTGRTITRHMTAKTNEFIDGVYDHEGRSVIAGDTDSVASDSLIRTVNGNMTIEELFYAGTEFWNIDDREFSKNPDIKIVHYSDDGTSKYQYVYRHKVRKKKYRITTDSGKSVVVTEDHSIMVKSVDGELVEKKPVDMNSSDVSVVITGGKFVDEPVKSVELLGEFEDEYVYDIAVEDNDPYFFANDILVHNSVYFSAYPTLREDIDSGGVVWTKESVIELYDTISEEVSKSFPKFLKETLNVPPKRGVVIQCGREVVGESGLFTKKKRYAILVYDEEGMRKDIDGELGKLKITGLDIRRSDTPKFVQEFLKEVLLLTLTKQDQEPVIERIREFKHEFRKMDAWKKGSPKAVNKLSHYGKILDSYMSGKSKSKPTIPGHVRASINWNMLRQRYYDKHSMPILDGQKVIVCSLKPNNDFRMTSVACPVDEPHLPDWFITLPFDDDKMEGTIVDKKLENLLSVLKWKLSRATPEAEHAESLFSFD